MIVNYGNKVDYVVMGYESSIWRLFYDDENYVYLISSKMNESTETCAVDEQKLSYDSYSGSADIKDEFLQSLNSEWFKVV